MHPALRRATTSDPVALAPEGARAQLKRPRRLRQPKSGGLPSAADFDDGSDCRFLLTNSVISFFRCPTRYLPSRPFTIGSSSQHLSPLVHSSSGASTS
eukprot:scaffold1071_cov252-Pinguiococcus_pyrenoidosus.AAC.9